jgi:hypothetical protein
VGKNLINAMLEMMKEETSVFVNVLLESAFFGDRKEGKVRAFETLL